MGGNLVTSLIRTFTPMLAGALLAWGVRQGIPVDDSLRGPLTELMAFGFGFGYYALARLLEHKWPATGVLLGVPKKPVYAPGSISGDATALKPGSVIKADPGALGDHGIMNPDTRLLLDQMRGMEQRLMRKMGAIMAAQDDVNAAVAQINATMQDVAAQVTQLGTDADAIRAAIANLPPEVDTTELNAAVAAMTATQQSLDQAVTGVTDALPPATS